MRFQWLLLIALLPSLSLAAEPLRYRFEPGQERVYRQHYRMHSTTNPSKTRYESWDQITFRTIRPNADGSWRMIECMQSGKGGFDSIGPISRFDIFDAMPDGECKQVGSTEYAGGGSLLRLPPDDQTTQWSEADDIDQGSADYTLAPATRPSVREITTHRSGGLNAIYQVTVAVVTQFDVARGYPLGDTSRIEQPLDHQLGEGTEWLESVRTMPTTAVSEFAADAEAVIAAQKKYRAAFADAVKAQPMNADALATALADVQKAQAAIRTPELRSFLDGIVAQQAAAIQDAKDNAILLASIMDRPSRPWSLKDLDGQTHSLAEQHGKVVVLDFWYRDCPWCMRAMPTMKRLGEEFKGRPVVFFGMNTDEKIEDAKYVIDFYKLPYASLRISTRAWNKYDSPTTVPNDANSPAEDYAISCYPTTVVLDGNGVVRLREEGFSDTLHETLSNKINELLPTTSAAGH